MKRFNKFFALFLAVVMIAGLLPAHTVSAAGISNVIFEEDFEDYTELEILTDTNPSVFDVVMHEAYYGTGVGEIVTDSGRKAAKLIPNGEKSSSWPGWSTAAYGAGRLAVSVDATKFVEGSAWKVGGWVKTSGAVNIQITINVPDTTYNKTLVNNTSINYSEWTWVEYELPVDQLPDLATTKKATVKFGISYPVNDASRYLLVDSLTVYQEIPYTYSIVEAELEKGDVQLQADVDGSDNDLVLKAGKTLDLNGKTLTVDSLSAMPGAKVIDTVGGGKLVVIDDNLTLQADNGYMPVKTEDGYIFVTVKDQHKPLVVEPNKLTYSTRPALEKVTSSTYLGNGAKDNGLSIIIRLTWTNTSNGTTTTMDVNCLDELVGEVYSGGNSFELIVTGVDSVENLQVATVICSDTGVVFVGDPLPYNAQQQ